MARAAVVLVHEGRVALISRMRAGRNYFLFPGGQVEEGESVEEAAAREALEELGVQVEIGRLAAAVQLLGTPGDGPEGRIQSYFWAKILRGEFGTGLGAELSSPADSPNGSHTPIWLSIKDLQANDIRPRTLANVLASGTFGPSSEPLHVVEELTP